MKIKIKILFCVLFILLITCLFNNQKIAQANVLSSAKSMIVIDANSSRVLLNKNENQKLPMASTTKIITALTVLNNCDNIDREIEINSKAVGISGTSIYLKQGEKLTVRELLYGMMLPSGNDAATALAYYIGGDIQKFCKLMEVEAIKCGAYNSSFANPHGLDEDEHYTTAYDLALLTAKALENDVFKEIVTTKSIRIKGSSEGSYRYLKNKNKLLNTLDGCIGVKTGYTGKAGRCLVSACERNGLRTVCVVLNCGPMFEESFELLNQAQANYDMVELLPEYKIIRKVIVETGRDEFVKVFTKKGFSYPLTKDEKERIEIRYNLPNSLKAPVYKDKIVGEIEIYLDNRLLFSEKIYTINNVKKIGVWSSIQDIISSW